MPNIYSSMFGNSPLGQSQKSFYDALSAISGSPPSTPMQQGQVGAQAGAMALQKAAPGAIQQQTQQQTQQNVAPLQASQTDLASLFPLWLHDQGLASKYASPTMTQPGSGVPTQATYNQPSANIVAGAIPPPGAGFSGFTTPSANTAAMGAVPTQTSNIMNLVQGAIGGQEDIISKNTTLASQNYQAAINGLLGLAQTYGEADIKNAQLNKLKAETAKIYQDMGADVNSGTDMTNVVVDPNASKKDKIARINAEIAKTNSPTLLKKLYDLKKQVQKSTGDVPVGQQTPLRTSLGIYKMTNEVIDALENPKTREKISKFMGTPQGQIISSLYGMNAGYLAQMLPGVDPEIEPVISNLNTLAMLRDKDLAGTRVAATLFNQLKPGQASLDKGIPYNLELLKTAKERIENGFQADAGMWGFDNWQDIPGVDESKITRYQTTQLQAPDGSVYQYDSTNDPDYQSDLQSGFKPL